VREGSLNLIECKWNVSYVLILGLYIEKSEKGNVERKIPRNTF